MDIISQNFENLKFQEDYYLQFIYLTDIVQYKIFEYLDFESLLSLRSTCKSVQRCVDQKRILEHRVLVHIKSFEQFENLIFKSTVPWANFKFDCQFPSKVDLDSLVIQFVYIYGKSIKGFQRFLHQNGLLCEGPEWKNLYKDCPFGSKFLFRYGKYILEFPQEENHGLEKIYLATLILPKKLDSDVFTLESTENEDFPGQIYLAVSLALVKHLKIQDICVEKGVKCQIVSEPRVFSQILNLCPNCNNLAISHRIAKNCIPKLIEIAPRLKFLDFLNIKAYYDQILSTEEFCQIFFEGHFSVKNIHYNWAKNILEMKLSSANDRIRSILVPFTEMKSIKDFEKLETIIVLDDVQVIHDFDGTYYCENSNLKKITWLRDPTLVNTNFNVGFNWLCGIERSQLKCLTLEKPANFTLGITNHISQNLKNLVELTIIDVHVANYFQEFSQIWENCTLLQRLVLHIHFHISHYWDNEFFGNSFLELKYLRKFCLWTEKTDLFNQVFTNIFQHMKLNTFRFRCTTELDDIEGFLKNFVPLINTPLSKSISEMLISFTCKKPLSKAEHLKVSNVFKSISPICQLSIREIRRRSLLDNYDRGGNLITEHNGYFLPIIDHDLGFGPIYQTTYCCTPNDARRLVIRKKMVFIGDEQCGKTSIHFVYRNKFFQRICMPLVLYKSENMIVNIEVDKQMIEVGVLDTNSYQLGDPYRDFSNPDTDILIICYSIGDRNSLLNVGKVWSKEVRRYCPKAPILLVGTKKDLRNDAKYKVNCVSYEEGEEMMVEIGAVGFLECSAFENEGIDQVMEAGTRAALKEPEMNETLKF